MISINTREAVLMKHAADVAAGLRTVETGHLVSRHAAMVEALRIGLATMLDIDPVEFTQAADEAEAAEAQAGA
tara:strand:- start:7264 stop:7482 length:219 start_codon:yes stop_codon:yes gene_type:complete